MVFWIFFGASSEVSFEFCLTRGTFLNKDIPMELCSFRPRETWFHVKAIDVLSYEVLKFSKMMEGWEGHVTRRWNCLDSFSSSFLSALLELISLIIPSSRSLRVERRAIIGDATGCWNAGSSESHNFERMMNQISYLLDFIFEWFSLRILIHLIILLNFWRTIDSENTLTELSSSIF